MKKRSGAEPARFFCRAFNMDSRSLKGDFALRNLADKQRGF